MKIVVEFSGVSVKYNSQLYPNDYDKLTTRVKIHVPVLGQNFPKPTKVRPGTNYVILQAAY